MVPIPGARRTAHVEADAAAADIILTPAELDAIEAAASPSQVAGARYSEAMMGLIDRS